MKVSLRLTIAVLNFLILGAIFVPPDFSSGSNSRLILNWFVRLLIAIGFCVASRLLSHVLNSSVADSYHLVYRGDLGSEPSRPCEEEVPFEQNLPRKSWSRVWSPRNLIFFAYCVALLSFVLHSAVLCEIIFAAVVVFLWIPNPWQSSADQPEVYEIAPRRLSQ
jgi:hypothetical protein